MPQYHLDKFFVPDDKDLFDMLKACHTSSDKLWAFARGYGIFLSMSNRHDVSLDVVSRFTIDRRKLQELFALNNTKDRDEKYSTKRVPENASVSRLKASITSVRDERTTGDRKEKYTLEDGPNGALNVKISYLEPDFSRTEALQVREREIKVQFTKVESGWSVRHHSNETAAEIVNAILKKIPEDMSKAAPVKALDFTGIRDPKRRTRFFNDLSRRMKGYELRDVPALKVHRLVESQSATSTEEEEEEEAKAAEAQVKKMVLSGTDLTHSQEYALLEARGFFISSISWTSEMANDEKEHFHFTAEFADADAPSDIKWGCTGKTERADDGSLKKYRCALTSLEKEGVLNQLEEAAFGLYDEMVAETKSAETKKLDGK